MSIANSEFQQVWGQVKEWPVELRQDLADEIAKSVESDLPASNDSWTEAKNARRVELIDREIQGALTTNQRRELALLEREMRASRHRVAPLPLQEATQLHEQLLTKKRTHDDSSGANP